MKNFVCYNGEILNSNQNVFSGSNRAFRYGDAIFETMRAVSTTVPLLNEHLLRIKQSANILNFELTDSININTSQKLISRLLNANKLFAGAKIRLTIYRKDGGNYLPINNNIDFLIEASQLDSNQFSLNTKGLKIDIFTEWKKPINILSNLKSANALIFVKSALFACNNQIDESIILNQNNYISETTSSNIFLYCDNKLYTPSIKSGCINGIMRKIIIEIALKNNFQIIESDTIAETDLLNADEIFLTNAVTGIRWVVAFKQRRYFCKIAKYFSDELLKHISSI